MITIEKDAVCPHCGAQHDRATHPTAERSPDPGDTAFCFDCGSWCTYTDDLQLRLCNDAELEGIGTDPACQRLREVWLEARPAHRRH